MAQPIRYKVIYEAASSSDRQGAFEEYWAYLLRRDGTLQEGTRTLEHKAEYYQSLQKRPILARQVLTSAPTMAKLAAMLATRHRSEADRRLLTLTVIYQFASHEAAGIRAAWRATPSWERCRTLTDRITRYHLCEEFCHLRLFAEMFKVFGLDVEWPPFSWPMRTAYGAFARCPNWLLAPLAFASEVMGISFYRHIWRVLEEVFGYEPEVLGRLQELLGEIMVDELGHIGERRCFLGWTGVRWARLALPMMMRRFFADIPGAELILDIDRMIQEALVFDYGGVDAAIAERAWIPAYCQV
jgi:hypothetical protein